ncbi:hypothetical protein BN1708_020265, partial [Verticillium longisporum]
ADAAALGGHYRGDRARQVDAKRRVPGDEDIHRLDPRHVPEVYGDCHDRQGARGHLRDQETQRPSFQRPQEEPLQAQGLLPRLPLPPAVQQLHAPRGT